MLKTCWRSLASRCHTADAAADVHELSSFSKSLQSTPRNVPGTGGGWSLYRRPWWPHAPRTRIARASPLFVGGPWLARLNGRAIWLSALPCPALPGPAICLAAFSAATAAAAHIKGAGSARWLAATDRHMSPGGHRWNGDVVPVVALLLKKTLII